MPIRQAIKKRLTRNQMKNGWTFYYKVDKEKSHQMESQSQAIDDPMDMSNIYEDLDYEYDFEGEYPLHSPGQVHPEADSTCSPNHQSSNSKITVKFQNVVYAIDSFSLECDRTESWSQILERFASIVKKDIQRIEFFNENSELLDVMLYHSLENVLDENTDNIQINFRINPQSSELRRTSKQSTPEPMITSTHDDSKSEKRLYLNFVDGMNNNEPMDLDYNGGENVATAIQQFSEVMEMNKSKVHFYSSDGE